MAEYNGVPTINVECIMTRDGEFSYRAETHNVPGGAIFMADPIPTFSSLRDYLASKVPQGYFVVSEVDIEGLKALVKFKGRKILQGLLVDILSNDPGAPLLWDKNKILGSGNEEDGIIVHLFGGWVTINDGVSNYMRPLNPDEKKELSDIVKIE